MQLYYAGIAVVVLASTMLLEVAIYAEAVTPPIGAETGVIVMAPPVQESAPPVSVVVNSPPENAPTESATPTTTTTITVHAPGPSVTANGPTVTVNAPPVTANAPTVVVQE